MLGIKDVRYSKGKNYKPVFHLLKMVDLENRLAIVTHGFMDDFITPWWSNAQEKFEEIGYDVHEVDLEGLGRTTDSPEKYAYNLKDQLEKQYDDIEEAYHTDEVLVVGHSMGGLIARYCVEELGYDDMVDTVITFGTPHKGTQVATSFSPFFEGARDLTPESDFLEDLNGDGVSENLDYGNFYTPNDSAIWPSENARIPENGEKNITNVKIGRDWHEVMGENMNNLIQVYGNVIQDGIRDFEDCVEVTTKAFTNPTSLFSKYEQPRLTSPEHIGQRMMQISKATSIGPEDLYTGHVTMLYNDAVWEEVEEYLETLR